DDGKLESVASNQYLGLGGKITKKFDVGFMYLTPEVQIDGSRAYYDPITEINAGDTNAVALEIEKSVTESLYSLGGLKIGKEFDLGNDWKLDASINGSYSYEFGEPLASAKGTIYGMEGKQLEVIKDVKSIGATAKVGTRIGLSKTYFDVYGEYSYSDSQRTKGGTGTLGIKYKFGY
ncbi:MAG: autotransporter domain-containing protein, partial [Fusobacteriaceae bacterium]